MAEREEPGDTLAGEWPALDAGGLQDAGEQSPASPDTLLGLLVHGVEPTGDDMDGDDMEGSKASLQQQP